jgi:mgtE-like transporter
MRRPRLPVRLRSALGPDARQGLVALGLNSGASLLAGAMLASLTGTLARYPGLLVLVPAAIGMRGNIFGSFGNRISTAIHSGAFSLSPRSDTLLGQNVVATGVLTVGISLLAAVVAKAIAVGMGVEDTVGLLDLVTVSIVGGVLASAVVLVGALGMAGASVRYGWDLDNVNAPLVSTIGDVVTLPALWLATGLLGIAVLTASLGAVLVVAAAGLLVWGWRTSRPVLRRVVRESVPVLVAAAVLSSLAGLTFQKSLDDLDAFPALLVLAPAFVSSAGSLGGVLSGRLSSKLLLGLVDADTRPSRAARADIGFVFLLALPVYALNGAGAHVVAGLLGDRSPGLVDMVALAILGGAVVMAFVAVVAYEGTVVAYRFGLDPDTYGIPIVSSSVDFVGALTLILTISILGIV